MRMYRPTSFAKAVLCAVACFAAVTGQARKPLAAEALVAVATNFIEMMETLAPRFTAASGHRLRLSSGSTGKLYAQIKNGAPYDVLMAADQLRPELLEASPQGVAGSRFTYAIGRLTLWSAETGRIGLDGPAALKPDSFRHLAIANPKLAPYGLAAQETLAALGLWDRLQGRIVQGENIGQVHSMVATGNAELGFVALSAVMSRRNAVRGSRWDVPPHLHQPIRQDALLLAHGANNGAARAFLGYLKSAEARKIIASFGYGAD